MVWMYEGAVFDKQPDEKYVGMVYEMFDKETKKSYVGITRFWKGKKKKGKKPSDWKNYNSSSRIVQELTEENPERFHKEILMLCTSITEMKTNEAYIQLNYYIHGMWDELYNEYIGLRLRIRKTPEGKK